MERERESSPERGRESKTRLLLRWLEPLRRSEREGERRRSTVAGVREREGERKCERERERERERGGGEV
jgi:hypothetical protein